jgi:hypothetical protein
VGIPIAPDINATTMGRPSGPPVRGAGGRRGQNASMPQWLSRQALHASQGSANLALPRIILLAPPQSHSSSPRLEFWPLVAALCNGAIGVEPRVSSTSCFLTRLGRVALHAGRWRWEPIGRPSRSFSSLVDPRAIQSAALCHLTGRHGESLRS